MPRKKVQFKMSKALKEYLAQTPRTATLIDHIPKEIEYMTNVLLPKYFETSGNTMPPAVLSSQQRKAWLRPLKKKFGSWNDRPGGYKDEEVAQDVWTAYLKQQVPDQEEDKEASPAASPEIKLEASPELDAEAFLQADFRAFQRAQSEAKPKTSPEANSESSSAVSRAQRAAARGKAGKQVRFVDEPSDAPQVVGDVTSGSVVRGSVGPMPPPTATVQQYVDNMFGGPLGATGVKTAAPAGVRAGPTRGIDLQGLMTVPQSIAYSNQRDEELFEKRLHLVVDDIFRRKDSVKYSDLVEKDGTASLLLREAVDWVMEETGAGKGKVDAGPPSKQAALKRVRETRKVQNAVIERLSHMDKAARGEIIKEGAEEPRSSVEKVAIPPKLFPYVEVLRKINPDITDNLAILGAEKIIKIETTGTIKTKDGAQDVVIEVDNDLMVAAGLAFSGGIASYVKWLKGVVAEHQKAVGEKSVGVVKQAAQKAREAQKDANFYGATLDENSGMMKVPVDGNFVEFELDDKLGKAIKKAEAKGGVEAAMKVIKDRAAKLHAVQQAKERKEMEDAANILMSMSQSGDYEKLKGKMPAEIQQVMMEIDAEESASAPRKPAPQPPTQEEIDALKARNKARYEKRKAAKKAKKQAQAADNATAEDNGGGGPSAGDDAEAMDTTA